MPEIFQRLFRADMLMASLFRNFLLADRIFRCLNRKPVHPKLPETHNQPLWEVWDGLLNPTKKQIMF